MMEPRLQGYHIHGSSGISPRSIAANQDLTETGSGAGAGDHDVRRPQFGDQRSVDAAVLNLTIHRFCTDGVALRNAADEPCRRREPALIDEITIACKVHEGAAGEAQPKLCLICFGSR